MSMKRHAESPELRRSVRLSPIKNRNKDSKLTEFLPNELIVQIAIFLDVKSLNNFRQTNHELNEILQANEIWTINVENMMKDKIISLEIQKILDCSTLSFREKYVELYKSSINVELKPAELISLKWYFR